MKRIFCLLLGCKPAEGYVAETFYYRFERLPRCKRCGRLRPEKE